MIREACERDEFRTPCSPEELQIRQITTDETRDSQAIYLDTPSWTADSRCFAFHRESSTDGRPAGLWLCEVEDGFAIRPICEYRHGLDPATPSAGMSYGCVLNPDGRCAYHLARVGDCVEVRRIDLKTGREEPVCAAPVPLRSRGAFALSADGERLLMGNFLGDGETEGAPWGAYIFSVNSGDYHVVEFGNGYRNMHCQYAHNPDPAYSHDIVLNAEPAKLSDGSWLTPPDGSWRWQDLPPEDPLGGAIHVVRDDGSNWRMLPIARDPLRVSGGHNTWRGSEYAIVLATYHHPPGRWRAPLLEATPVAAASEDELWLGERHPRGHPVDLTRKLARADACHFGFDASGKHFVSDSDGYAIAQYSFLYVGSYQEPPDEDPYVTTRYLLLPRTSWKTQPAHPHPYLSPDGKYVVFQSDFSGRPQVHVAYGFDYP